MPNEVLELSLTIDRQNWRGHDDFWVRIPDEPIRMQPEEKPSTESTSQNFETNSPNDHLFWGDVVFAAQETSFAFLKNEPDLYTDADGEPV